MNLFGGLLVMHREIYDIITIFFSFKFMVAPDIGDLWCK